MLSFESLAAGGGVVEQEQEYARVCVWRVRVACGCVGVWRGCVGVSVAACRSWYESTRPRKKRKSTGKAPRVE